MITLKALSYFRDGDLPALPSELKQLLLHATAATEQLVKFEPAPGGILPAGDL